MDIAEQHRDFSVTKKWLEMSLTLFPPCSPYSICSAPVGELQPPCTMDIYETSPWDFQEGNTLSRLFPFATFSGIHSVPKHGLKLGEKWLCVKLGEKHICVFCTTDPVAWVTLENICSRSSQPTKPTNSA